VFLSVVVLQKKLPVFGELLLFFGEWRKGRNGRRGKWKKGRNGGREEGVQKCACMSV
jgi:hypothetical protein